MLDSKKLLSELRQELDEAEKTRLNHYGKVRPFKIGFNLGMLTCLGLVTYSLLDIDERSGAMGYAGAIFMICLIVYEIKRSYEYGQFKDHFQRNVVSKIITKIGPEFSYDPRGGFPENRIEDCKLFLSFNSYLTEDMVSGKIGTRSIGFSEIKLVNRSGSDSSKNSTVFSGIYAEIKLSGKIEASCWLLPKKKTFSKSEGVSRVKLDESEHKLLGKYTLYSTDETFAKKLFNSTVLEKIMSVNKDLRSRKVIWGNLRIAFIGDTIRLGFSIRRKFMEPELFMPINTEAFLKKELALLTDCMRLADIV